MAETVNQLPDAAVAEPVLRARSFAYLCEHKTVTIGADELIVGERGTGPKATSTKHPRASSRC